MLEPFEHTLAHSLDMLDDLADDLLGAVFRPKAARHEAQTVFLGQFILMLLNLLVAAYLKRLSISIPGAYVFRHSNIAFKR